MKDLNMRKLDEERVYHEVILKISIDSIVHPIENQTNKTSLDYK